MSIMNKTMEEKAADTAAEYMVFTGGILHGYYDAYLTDIINDCRTRAEMIVEYCK